MTKVSREILLLRAQVADSAMTRLVEFEQSDGDPIFINPRDVSIVEAHRGGARVVMKSGEEKTVVGTDADVASRLEG